jgi:Tfp pilus assembly protein PilO
MNSPDNSGDNADLRSRLLARLHDPLQLRIVLTVLVVAVGYLGIYMPLSGEINETCRKLAAEEHRLELARSIEHLRQQFHNLEGRLTEQTDSKEWVNYVLEGIRALPLKLIALDCDAPRELGPYKAVVLRIELEGRFADLDAFLCWLESNQRLFRTDSMRLVPARAGKDAQLMQLTVLGVMG